MAATIGSLAVRIGADVTGLISGLDKSSSKIDTFGGKVRQSTNDMVKYAAATAAAGAAIGAVLIKSQISAARETKNLAHVSDISVEAFQRETAAVKRAGIEKDKYADILKDVKDRVGDFLATGGGPMADFFENIAPKVGVTIDQFKNLSGSQGLQLYVSSLEKANVSQAEMTFYMEAMASDATALLPLLRNNGEGMKKFGDEAEQAGAVLSSIDIEKLIAADEAIKRAEVAVDGLTKKLAVDFAPVIVAISDEFFNAAASSQNFGLTAINSVKMIMTPIGVLLDGLHGIKVAAKGVEVVFKGLGFGAVSSFNMIVKGYTELANLIPGIDIDFQDTFLGKLEQSAADATTKAAAELHELAMTKIPSEQIDDFLARVQNASKVAAEAVQANRALISGGGGDTGGGATGDGGASDKTRERLAAQLQAVQDQFATEQELLLQKVEADHIILVESLEADLITKGEYWDLEQKLKSDHEDQLNRLEETASKRRMSIAQAEASARKQVYNQMFTDMASLMNSGSRKMFEVGKAAAIAQTVISTISAAQSAYSAMAGIPYIGPALGIAAAAAATASGMARVSAIKSTSFGGGATAPSGDAGGLSAPSSAPTSAEQGATGSSRVISVQGISPDTLISGRMLVDLLNQAQEDGARLVIS